MKILIVYDSTYGNTEEIARAIGEAITGEVKILRVGGADPSETFDLLIVGSPTHGGRPTQAIQNFTKRVPALNGAPVAAFDTRLSTRLAKIFGYAAGRIGKTLEKKGARALNQHSSTTGEIYPLLNLCYGCSGYWLAYPSTLYHVADVFDQKTPRWFSSTRRRSRVFEKTVSLFKGTRWRCFDGACLVKMVREP